MSIWNHPVILALSVAGTLVALAILLLAAEAERRDLTLRISAVTQRPLGNRAFLMKGRGRLIYAFSAIGQAARSYALVSEKDVLALEAVMRAAGISTHKGVLAFIGAKMSLMLAAPAAAWLYATLTGVTGTDRTLFAAGTLAVSLFVPNWLLGSMAKRFEASLRLGLGDAIDLMVVCTEAGLGLDTALERVATEMRHTNRAIASEFAFLVQEMRMLPNRADALTRMGERTKLEGLVRLGATLAQTLALGTPLGKSLRILAAEMRQDRLVRFEERAARLPALLVMPLLLFIMPCLFIVLLGPSMLSLFKTM